VTWNTGIYAYLLLYFLLTYFLTPWSRVLVEKLIGSQLIKKFPVFCGTWRFITAFTWARHLSLSWASSIQSMPPHPTSWRSILILSSHLRLGLPNGLFHSGFPTKILYTPLLSPIRSTCPAHPIFLDLIRTIVGEEYRSWSFSLCSFHHSPVTSSLFSPGPRLSIWTECGFVSTSSNSQAGGPSLVGCPRLFIQYIRSSLPHWRPFLHTQPEDAPCRGNVKYYRN
jgi:hypothetical protein